MVIYSCYTFGMKKYSAGFSLVEIMVVVVIIGIISSFTYVSFSKSSAKGRDAERKTDLRALQAAIEQYKSKEGLYPEGCNAAGSWSGQVGTIYECPSASGEYILGLAPEYIAKLPTDPKLVDNSPNPSDSGYIYLVNSERSVYKLMALNTVESELVTYNHPLVRCGDMVPSSNECKSVPPNASGVGPYNQGFLPPSQCNTASIYNNDYAVWGGYASGANERIREFETDRIRCK